MQTLKGRADPVGTNAADGRDDQIRIEQIERQFDRVQALLSRVDSKVNAVFAITSAEIALASLAASGGNWHRWQILVPAALFIFAVAISLHDLYRCTFPRMRDYGGKSLVYFAELAKLDESRAIEAYSKITPDEFRTDLVIQTWRTSVIAAEKFRYLRRATFAALMSLAPWVFLLAVSSWMRH